MRLPKKVIVNDLTLREGRQIEGIVLSLDELLRIAEQLDDLGTPMVQLSLLGWKMTISSRHSRRPISK